MNVGDKVRVLPSRDHGYGGQEGRVLSVGDPGARWPIRVDIPTHPAFAENELEVVT